MSLIRRLHCIHVYTCIRKFIIVYIFHLVYSPSPSIEPTLANTIPVWQLPVLAGVPSLVVILIVLLLGLGGAVLMMKKKKGKEKILPISSERGEEIDGEENVLQITKSKSLVRMTKNGKSINYITYVTISYLILLTGSSLQMEQLAVTASNTSSPAGTFQEPEQLGSKLRWQIIQLVSVNKEQNQPINKNDLLSIEETELQIMLDQEQSDEFEEVVFLKGVYLESTATLKELRNVFVDSKQLEKGSLYFQFLLSDTPGDLIPIDDEEEMTLKRFEDQERTVYIQLISKSEQ